MSVAVTAPIVLGFKKALNVFEEFDTEATRVGLILGATAEEVAAVREEAIRLGAEFGRFSPQDAISGMEMLAAAGLNTTQTLQAIEPTLQLAEAAGLDVAFAAEVAAGAMNAFRFEASELGHVNDVIAKAMNVSALAGEDLGVALSHAGQLGSTANQSIEAVTAGLIAMRQQGVPAAQAGVALRQAMDSLRAPLAKGEKAIKLLGIELRDARGEMKPWPDIVRQMEDALADGSEGMARLTRETGLSGQAARDWAFRQLFGVQGAKAMALALNASTVVVNDGAEATRALAKVMGEDYVNALRIGQEVTLEGADAVAYWEQSLVDSEGTAKQFSEEMRKTLGAALKNTGGALESLAISFIEVLEPAIVSFLNDTLIPFIDKLREWVRENPEMTRRIAAFAAALAGIGPALLIGGTALKVMGAALSAITGTGALKWVKSLIGPLGIVIGLVGSVIARSPELQQSLGDAFLNLAGAAATLFDAIMPVVSALITAMTPAVQALVEVLVIVLNALTPLIEVFAAWVAQNPALVAAVVTFAGVFWGVLKVVGLVTTAFSLFGGVVTGLGTVMATLGGIIRTAVIGAFNLILAHPIVAAIAAIIAIVVLLIANWEKVGPFFQGLWNWVVNVFTTAVNWIRGLWNGMASWMGGVWTSISNAVRTGVNTVKSILGGIKGAIDNVISWFGGLWNKVTGIFKGIGDTIRNGVEKAKNWLSRLNPFARHSPSLVDQVTSGVDVIGERYKSLGGLDIDGPNVWTTLNEDGEMKSGSDAVNVFLIGIAKSLLPIEVTGGGGGGGGVGGGDGGGLGSGVDESIDDLLDEVKSGGGVGSGIDAVGEALKEPSIPLNEAAREVSSASTRFMEANDPAESAMGKPAARFAKGVRDLIDPMKRIGDVRQNPAAAVFGSPRSNLPVLGPTIEKAMRGVLPKPRSRFEEWNIDRFPTPEAPKKTQLRRDGKQVIINNPKPAAAETSLRRHMLAETFLGADSGVTKVKPSTQPTKTKARTPTKSAGGGDSQFL